jgi:hypothetical protein
LVVSVVSWWVGCKWRVREIAGYSPPDCVPVDLVLTFAGRCYRSVGRCLRCIHTAKSVLCECLLDIAVRILEADLLAADVLAVLAMLVVLLVGWHTVVPGVLDL